MSGAAMATGKRGRSMGGLAASDCRLASVGMVSLYPPRMKAQLAPRIDGGVFASQTAAHGRRAHYLH
jgi:hypothetical protein